MHKKMDKKLIINAEIVKNKLKNTKQYAILSLTKTKRTKQNS